MVIDCPKKEKNEALFSKIVEGTSEQIFYVSCTLKEKEGVWYVNSGCNSHMTGTKEIFVSLDEKFKSKVKLRDEKSMDVEGKGVIVVQTKRGNMKHIKDVLYVPLLS